MEKVMDKSKGQKIVAAIYLVTRHLSDTDPIKTALRCAAVSLMQGTDIAVRHHEIDCLLGGASLAGLISEKNASIILLELKHFVIAISDTDDGLGALFETAMNTRPSSQSHSKTMSVMTPSKTSFSMSISKNNETKEDRKNTILSFINERKSAGIKDISSLFPDLSEKTIQRELGTLVSLGQVTKRGTKRWSVYMASGSSL